MQDVQTACVFVCSHSMHLQSCHYVFVRSHPYVPASFSQWVSTCSIHQLLSHMKAGVGWRGGCSTVDALVPVARREPAPRLPPQPIVTIEESSAPMRRFSEVVGRCSGSSSWSFFHWFLNGVVSCRTSKQVSGVVFSPPALSFSSSGIRFLVVGR